MRLHVRSLAHVSAILLLVLGTAIVGADEFKRGDANTTGEMDIADPISTLSYLFNGGPGSSCPDAADSNDDGTVDIGDPIWSLSYLFFGDAPPPSPGPLRCGADPTLDRLGPCVYPECASADPCIDLTFSGAGGVFLDSAEIEASMSASSRQATTVYAYLEGRLAADSADSDRIIVLERFKNDSGVHAFFYARVRDDGVTVDAATNLPVVAGAFGPRTGAPGAIRERTIVMNDSLEDLFADLDDVGATSGLGGKSEMFGGSTHLMSVEKRGECTQHATYGYRYPVSSSAPSGPAFGENVARYEQNLVGYELWARIFGSVLVGPGGGGAAGAVVVAAQGLCIEVDPDDPDFRADTLDALKEISPCWVYTVSSSGEVTIQSPADHVQFCECFKRHKAGTNLISDLILGGGKTTIGPSDDGNWYDPSDDLAGFDTDAMEGGVNANGNRRRSPAVGLAHELIHALHDRNGTIDLDGSRTDGILDEEITTVRGENQIRGELGEPMRTEYGGNVVPDNTTKTLDESNRYDCPCPESEGEGDTGGGDGDGQDGGDTGGGDRNPGDDNRGGDTGGGDRNPGDDNRGDEVPGDR